MQIHSVSSMPGLFIPMTSPKFHTTTPHCLYFDYDVTSKVSDPAPSLKVHIRVSDYMLTGHSIWTLPTVGQGRAEITVPEMSTPDSVVLDFIGVIGDPMKSLIRFTNVLFEDRVCSEGDDATNYELTAGTFRTSMLIYIVSCYLASLWSRRGSSYTRNKHCCIP